MGVLWITGLSGSGKTTFAKEIISEKSVYNWIHLDGDQLRPILNTEQSYDRNSRLTLAKKYSKLAKLLSLQNHNIIVSTISLFHEIHEWNRNNIENYFEIFIDADVQTLQKRDDKGVYSTKSSAEIIGVGMEFDKPRNPDFVFNQKFDKFFMSQQIEYIFSRLEWKI